MGAGVSGGLVEADAGDEAVGVGAELEPEFDRVRVFGPAGPVSWPSQIEHGQVLRFDVDARLAGVVWMLPLSSTARALIVVCPVLLGVQV